MKKTLYLIFVMILSVTMVSAYLPIRSNAEDKASIIVKPDKTEVEKGGTVNVTVTVTSGVSIGFLKYLLTFDDSLVTFIPEGSQEPTISVIEEKVDTTKDMTTYTAKYKFVSKAVGTVGFTLSDVKNISLETVEDIPTSITNASVKIIEKSKSGNCKLKAMQPSAGSLSPKFSPDTLDYTVTVPAGTDVCYLYCDVQDSHAKTALSGSEYLKVGENVRKCTVTAENGDTKVYTVKIIRPSDPTSKPTEKPTETPDPSATIDPMNTPEIPEKPAIGDVTINENVYTIYNITNELNIIFKDFTIRESKNFLFDQTIVNGINAYGNGTSPQYLVMASKDGGEKQLYVFDTEDKSIQRYLGPEKNIVTSFDVVEKGEIVTPTGDISTIIPSGTPEVSPDTTENPSATQGPRSENEKPIKSNVFALTIGAAFILILALVILALVFINKKN